MYSCLVQFFPENFKRLHIVSGLFVIKTIIDPMHERKKRQLRQQCRGVTEKLSFLIGKSVLASQHQYFW